MNLSKSLLLVVNTVIAVIISAGGTVLYYAVDHASGREWEKDGSGGKSFSIYEMDIEYVFESIEGEVLMDNYFLRFDKISVHSSTSQRDFFPRDYRVDPKPFDSGSDLYDIKKKSVTELFIPVKENEVRGILILRVFVYATWIGSALYILFGLRSFIHKSIKEDFFDKRNYLLLMRIGLVLSVYSIVHFVFYSIFEILVTDRMGRVLRSHQSIWFDYRFQWEFATCGLLLILISMAFRQGAMLKREQELTI